MRKVIGVILLAAPFVAIAAVAVVEYGLVPTLYASCAAALAIGCFWVGMPMVFK